MLKFEKIILRSASLPKESKIPDIKSAESVPFFAPDETVPESDGLIFGEGMVASTLPYGVQSLYKRDFTEREFDAAVLENDRMRAVFLTSLGGRLWSLYDKRLGRELLYRNRVIAFANLAIRNAWFAGGVEWNIGVRGHTHMTASPMFVARERNASGDDILKMYEYESVRGLAYVIRAALFEDTLRINITVENTKNTPTYIYWWSNIAVPQASGSRVVVPAEESYVTDYRDGGYAISKTAIPLVNGRDISYPKEAPCAKDYFFDIKPESKKWIAALMPDGVGLMESSDKTLIGRKLFVWGNTAGGVHWNDWLTEGDEYAEIQAGLAKTQFEHLPFGAKEIISWNECYRSVSDCDMHAEYSEVAERLDKMAPVCDFGDFFAPISEECISYGSGRGALASMISADERATICSYPEDSACDYGYYIALLRNESYNSDKKPPFLTDKRYLDIIERKKIKTDLDRYIGGVIAYANGDAELAERYLLSVLGSLYSDARLALAMLASALKKDNATAFEYAKEAYSSGKLGEDGLAILGEIAQKAKEYAYFASLPEVENLKEGRLALYRVRCLVKLGRLDEARELLTERLVVPDIREGEIAISDIWAELYARVIERDRALPDGSVSFDDALREYPLPYALDFRMH